LTGKIDYFAVIMEWMCAAAGQLRILLMSCNELDKDCGMDGRTTQAVTLSPISYFKAEGKPQPTFLLDQHPMQPPKPIAAFAPHSATMGFDFNYNSSFGPVGEVFIAEFGSEAPDTTGGKPTPGVGHRISRINTETGKITPFAMNKTGVAAFTTEGGGLERPIDVIFGKQNEMFLADFGIVKPPGKNIFAVPKTGVIWKMTKR
jgi:hypothetical protein